MNELLVAGISQRDLLQALVFYLAWNVQMGLHEGGHAIVADRLGDSVPRMMGKVTINPAKHIEWDNPNYVVSAVVFPAITALAGWIPFGMAWVPISGHHSTVNHAKIALAGPIGSFLAAGLGLLFWFLAVPLLLQMGNSQVSEQIWMLSQLIAMGMITTGVLYGVFNLIPIPPLDGSNVAYHFMNPQGRHVMDTIRPYGFFAIIIIFFVFDAGRYIFDPIFEVMFWVMAKTTAVWV